MVDSELSALSNFMVEPTSEGNEVLKVGPCLVDKVGTVLEMNTVVSRSVTVVSSATVDMVPSLFDNVEVLPASVVS